MNVQAIAIDLIIPTTDNPRGPVSPKDPLILEMAESMRHVGQLQNGVARPHPTKPGYFDLRAGARRLAAARLAGLPTMDLAILDLDDKAAMKVTVMENLQHESLTPLAESRGIARLLELGYDAGEIASEMGKPAVWIKRRAQLQKLTKDWQEAAEKYLLPASVLELVARYDELTQLGLFNRHAAHEWDAKELSHPDGLAHLKRDLAQATHELRLAPWPLGDALLLPKAGACLSCPKRVSCNPDLFEEFAPKKGKQPADQCLDEHCWDEKGKAYTAARMKAVLAEHKHVLKVSTRDSYTGKRTVLGNQDFTIAKEGDKKAVPALDCSNGDALVWVVPKKTRAGEAAERMAAGKPALSLQERRDGLARRRMAHVIQRLKAELDVVEKLSAVPHYATAQGLVELVAIFGGEARLDADEPFPGTSVWKALQKAKKDPERAMLATWRLVCVRMSRELDYYQTGNIGPDHEEAARQIAPMLGLKYDTLAAEAAREIPEPKAWANEQ